MKSLLEITRGHSKQPKGSHSLPTRGDRPNHSDKNHFKPLELKDESIINQWVASLQSKFDTLPNQSNQPTFTIQIKETAEDTNNFAISITSALHGVKKDFSLSEDFFGSADYRAICELQPKLSGLIEEGAHVQRGENQINKRFPRRF